MTQRRLEEYASRDDGEPAGSPRLSDGPTVSLGRSSRRTSPSIHYNGRDVLVLTYVPRIGYWMTQRVAKRGR